MAAEGPRGHSWGCLLTIVIEAVGDLMPNDHADAAVVERLGLLGAEEGRLQDACWEDWGGERGVQSPTAAVSQLLLTRVLLATSFLPGLLHWSMTTSIWLPPLPSYVPEF